MNDEIEWVKVSDGPITWEENGFKCIMNNWVPNTVYTAESDAHPPAADQEGKL